MTAHQFLINKGVLTVKQLVPVLTVQKWLEEFAKENAKQNAAKPKSVDDSGCGEANCEACRK